MILKNAHEIILNFMGNYKVLNHTADLKVEFSAENLEQLLNVCAEYLSEKLYEKKSNNSSLIYEKWFEFENEVEFLISFLNEILFLMQYKRFLLSQISMKKEKGKILISFMGEETDIKPQMEIKAATYHNANIEKNGNILKAIITFDL